MSTQIPEERLAIATRTVPQMSRITPRWRTALLQWVPLEVGIYRAKDAPNVTTNCPLQCIRRDGV